MSVRVCVCVRIFPDTTLQLLLVVVYPFSLLIVRVKAKSTDEWVGRAFFSVRYHHMKSSAARYPPCDDETLKTKQRLLT